MVKPKFFAASKDETETKNLQPSDFYFSIFLESSVSPGTSEYDILVAITPREFFDEEGCLGDNTLPDDICPDFLARSTDDIYEVTEEGLDLVETRQRLLDLGYIENTDLTPDSDFMLPTFSSLDKQLR